MTTNTQARDARLAHVRQHLDHGFDVPRRVAQIEQGRGNVAGCAGWPPPEPAMPPTRGLPAPVTTPSLRRRAWLPLAASALLAACAGLGPEGRPYHAFELGVAKNAGTVQHLRWQYGDITSLGEKPVAMGTGRAFALRRQAMPVPEVFEARWQGADGQWRLARLPVRSVLRHRVEGHSLLFWITADGLRGEYITYTPRGDVSEPLGEVRAELADEATAARIAVR